jgi:Type I restriction and modification enzyme - subunit R C terminal
VPHKTDLEQVGDKANVIEAFFSFAQAEQQREAQELINSEKLNAEAAKRYIKASLKREYASDSDTDLNAVLPKMSQFESTVPEQKAERVSKISGFCREIQRCGWQHLKVFPTQPATEINEIRNRQYMSRRALHTNLLISTALKSRFFGKPVLSYQGEKVRRF